MRRHDQIDQHLRDLVAEFLNNEKVPGVLVTVTRCAVATNLKTATCFVSIFPRASAVSGLAQLQSQLHALREWLRDKLDWRVLPVLDFKLEKGDK